MDLHYSDGETPDWEKVPPEDWNYWQKIASETNGIVTPGNILSVGGFASSACGIVDIYQGRKAIGLAKIAGGRLADLADGAVANKTGTKSITGKKLDIFVDKWTKAASAYTVMDKFGVPKLPVIAMYALGLTESAVALSNKHKWADLQPSQTAKLAAFGEFSSMGLYALSDLLKDHGIDKTAKVIKTLGHVGMAASLVLRTEATHNLFKDINSKQIAE